MEESLLAQSSPVILLIGATIFVVLFTVILTTLREPRSSLTLPTSRLPSAPHSSR